MATDPTRDPSRLLSRVPLLALAAGGVVCALAAALSRLDGPGILPELVLFLGSMLVVVGIGQRLKATGWGPRDRVETAAFVSTGGAVAGGLAAVGLNPAWGAARLLFGMTALFAFISTLLILLPSRFRKIALSVWVVFHFLGMFVTFSSIDPPNGQGPFLSRHLYMLVYRPYLQALYLTNAYHFYSPDPGPPSLLWFSVQYSDGKDHWIYVPNRRQPGQIGAQYQRLLALPEHTFSADQGWPLSLAQLAGQPQDRFSRDQTWEAILERRIKGSLTPFGPEGRLIPFPIDLDYRTQYRPPNVASKKMVAAVARRVMRIAPKREGAEVRSVKMYRVTQQILTPYEVTKGVKPDERPKFWASFLGEFNTDGEIVNEYDPFLYWYIPTVYVPTTYPNHPGGRHPEREFLGAPIMRVQQPAVTPNFLLDGLKLHAAGPAKGGK